MSHEKAQKAQNRKPERQIKNQSDYVLFVPFCG
jgi:hypothetical protein